MTDSRRHTGPAAAAVARLAGVPPSTMDGLAPAPAAAGSYVPWVRDGRLISVSLQLPWRGDALAYRGHLGAELDAEDGRNAARICADNLLAQLTQASDNHLGHVRLLRVEGHVGCVAGFDRIPHVLDGASERLLEVLGEAGLHARTALGHHVTPLHVPVMIGAWATLGD